MFQRDRAWLRPCLTRSEKASSASARTLPLLFNTVSAFLFLTSASRNKKGEISTMVFHAILGIASTTAGVYPVSPSGFSGFSTRFATEGDGFGYFKINWLKFRCLASGVGQNMGASPVVDTYPSSSNQIMELYDSGQQTTTATHPTDWISVRKPMCAGPFNWYKSISGTFDQTEESPFVLCQVNSSATTCFFELMWSASFKEPIAPANTPVPLPLLRSRREAASKRIRERMLQVLSAQDTAVPSTALSKP